MSSRADLRVDWCTHEAAKYAVEHWHYSRTVPRNKLVKLGAWERGRFVGCVIFGCGASDALGASYGASADEACELVRVALAKHETPVTRIVSVSLRFLRRANPGLRLVVSFADPSRGHHGGIYQGGGWIYAGMTDPADEYIVNGVRMHGRAIRKTMERYAIPGANTLERIRAWRDPSAVRVDGVAKHRYLYPLDPAMRAQVAPLARPYPKRSRVESAENGTAIPIAGGGVNPTSTLQSTDPPCPE